MKQQLPTAVILAGGLGTRLRPLVSDRPKALAVVAGRPFILYQLEWLCRNFVQSVIICVGYKGEQIVDCLGDGSHLGMKIAYSRESTPLGTAGALAEAAHLLPAEFLVLNGDTYTAMELEPLWEAHHRRGALATLAAAPAVHVKDSAAVGSIKIGPDGRILSFREKQPGAKLVSMGIYAVSRELVPLIPRQRPCSLERDVFPNLPGLYGYLSPASFIDIGTPTGYRAANRQLSKLPT